MAATDIVIDGEQFSIVSLPNAGSKLVQSAKEHLLGPLDLPSLVEDLKKLGNFIRVAYNGVAGHTELQIKVQRVGYKITKLADKSAVTVHKFKGASQSVLKKLKGTYQYLLDGLEEMALETLSQLTSVAEDMAAAADELHNDFEKATTDVQLALEDTQKTKGSEEKRKEAREKERKDFETKKQQAVIQQQEATKAEAEAKALYVAAQEREDKAFDADLETSALNIITDAFIGIISATASLATFQLNKARQKIAEIGYKEAMKMANEEKKKHLEEMQKQRDLRQEALLQCLEFTEKIKNCTDDDALAEAAIEALHSSIGALKSLSAIMMNAVMFWKQMQGRCEKLASESGAVQKGIAEAMKMGEGWRIKVWTSEPFQEQAIEYYSGWVALDCVCGEFMSQIKETRQDLYNYLKDNPTIEQARKNVRELATNFGNDIKEAQEKLEEKNMKALKAKKELERSDE